MPHGDRVARGGRSHWRALVSAVVLLRIWHVAQSRVSAWPARRQWVVYLAFACVSVAARLWAQTNARNYDFDSYRIVSETVLNHGNPYETGRYNYGPVWFLIISGIRFVAENPDRFRLMIAIFLAAVDLGIGYVLMRRGYLLAGCLVLVAPVAVAISGQHQQFDNVAVLSALVGVGFVPTNSSSRLSRADAAVVLLLGFSLMSKHLFIIFPYWLAIQQRSVARALVYLTVPPAIFVASLAPFWIVNSQAVTDHVLKYQSFNNAPLLTAVLPDGLAHALADTRLATLLFLVAMCVLGMVFRRVPPFENALVYTISLVVFSSAMTDQYLAIPVAGVAVFLNIGFLLWIVLASAYLLGNPETFDWAPLVQFHSFLSGEGIHDYQRLVVPLFAGWVIMTAWLRGLGKSVELPFAPLADARSAELSTKRASHDGGRGAA